METTSVQAPGKPLVPITVNGKVVQVEGPKATGAKIKAAAIAQGVQIQEDFVLSQELANRESKIIGDSDTVTINRNSSFTAVAPDDNS